MLDKRFHALLGDEYNLSMQVIPHFFELQEGIANAVKAYCATLPQPEISLIEIGVGTGLTTQYMLEADARIQVMGVDNEEKMLRQAEALLQPWGARVQLRCADALQWLKELPNGSVDICASSQTLHNFTPEYRRAVFVEIARVLKPNGVCVNGDKYARNDATAHRKDFTDRLEHFKTFTTLGRPDLAAAWSKHNEEDEKVKITEGEQLELFRELGFHSCAVVYRECMEAIITAQR